ncbi:MAG: hypothetical protein JXA33_21915 [Anaerolineae bacterium]|nr:hypothetical protein [Anaerolineae bacterium]
MYKPGAIVFDLSMRQTAKSLRLKQGQVAHYGKRGYEDSALWKARLQRTR